MSKKPGRRSKLTPERLQAFIAAIHAGLTQAKAAKAVGVTEKTLYRWLEKAEQPKAPKIYGQLRQQLREGPAEAERQWLEAIERCIKGEKGIRRKYDNRGNLVSEEEYYLIVPQWTAAAWKLERSDPERWGKKSPDTQVNVQVNQHAQIAVKAREMSREQVLARIEELRAKQLGPGPEDAGVIDVEPGEEQD